MILKSIIIFGKYPNGKIEIQAIKTKTYIELVLTSLHCASRSVVRVFGELTINKI